MWEGDHKHVPVEVDVESELATPWVTWFIDCATKAITGVAVTALARCNWRATGTGGRVRIVGRPLHQLGVESRGVPAPQRREMRRLHPDEAVIRGQPPPHRLLRLPQRLSHQTYMRGRQLSTLVEVQQSGASPPHAPTPAGTRSSERLRDPRRGISTCAAPPPSTGPHGLPSCSQVFQHFGTQLTESAHD